MNTKFNTEKGVSLTYFSISSTRNDKLVRGFRDELGTEYIGSMPRLYRMHKLSTGVIPNINLQITTKKKKILTFNTSQHYRTSQQKSDAQTDYNLQIIHSPPNL